MVRDEAEPVVLLAALRDALERGRSCILLNVGEVDSVDSLWLGAMVQGYTTAVRKGGTIKLVHVSKRFHELLAVTKLDQVLEVFESEDEAIATETR
jgi:anti-sigma B factor antagonist